MSLRIAQISFIAVITLSIVQPTHACIFTPASFTKLKDQFEMPRIPVIAASQIENDFKLEEITPSPINFPPQSSTNKSEKDEDKEFPAS